MDDFYRESLEEWNRAAGIPISLYPDLPDREEAELRFNLLQDEWDEYVEAYENDDIVEIADAMADMLYILHGTALSYGFNLADLFKEVHRSNMTKLVDGKIIRRSDGKILKPDTYEEPQLARILSEAGCTYFWASRKENAEIP